MGNLLAWLDKNGILLCNANPELPALEDIGCTWQDAMKLIDERRLFYCKTYKKRTTYLSVEAYYLLKALRPQKAMPASSQELYRLLTENPGADSAFLKSACGMESKEYRIGLDFLLQNLFVTALKSGRTLNENWSELLYVTAEEWERLAPAKPATDSAKARLWSLVGNVMTERQFMALLR